MTGHHTIRNRKTNQQETTRKELIDLKDSVSAKGDGIVISTSSDSSVDQSSPYSFSNFVWLTSAVFVIYYTDIMNTLLYDVTIHRSWLYVGLSLLTVQLSIASYLIIYLSTVCKLSSEAWDTRCPYAIPIATGCAALAGVCFIVSLWPVWSFLTPVIFFVILMGFIVFIAMIPSRGC